MRSAATVARYLPGLIFVAFGLNGFLNFIPQPPPPSPLVGQFMTVMFVSHYLVPVFALQLAAGLILLSGRFTALALALLAPILVNILIYHITMDPASIAPGLIATVLWAILFARHRAAFSAIFQAAA